MNLSRRAQPSSPLPESRRASDFYRPVTTAAYGTPRPLVIGQQRVPTTIVRDGRNVGGTTGAAVDGVLHCGLCEGPIQSVGKIFLNQGASNPQIGTVSGAAAHTIAPLPWAGIDPANSNVSMEVSTDITLAGADAAYIPFLSNPDTGLTIYGQPLIETDFHYCATGSGASLKEYVVAWSWSSQSLTVRSRTAGGSWSLAGTVAGGAVNPSSLPVGLALPQPRIAAVGNLVHVVWSRLDNTQEPVQICHAWSTDGGSSWTIGQSLIPATKSNAIGAFKLSISLHSSGEVWTCFQKRNTATSPTPNNGVPCGAYVGFLPSNAISSTAWIQPDLTSKSNGVSQKGELCLIDPTLYPIAMVFRNLLRAPSIMAVGSGKALLSCVFNAPPGPAASLYVLPVKADTLVRWDLPAAALSLYAGDTEPHSNVASIVWLEANGYPARTLGWTPNSANDLFNEGHTQLVGQDASNYSVLVNHAPVDTSNPYWTPDGSPAKWMWGAWRVYSVSPAANFSVDLTTASKPGFAASAFWNGTGQIFVAFGRPTTDEGWTYTAPKVHIMCVNLGVHTLTDWCEYFPATSLNNSMAHQIWAGNGEAFAIWREDEDNNGYFTCGVREITHTTGYGDVLPSVMAKRLLAGDAQRGLDIRHLTFDTATWDKFGVYCTAMGIRFSIALTSQEAAWPLVCNILESANAVPYRSQGLLKIFARETATIGSYAPLPEHAAPCVDIPKGDLRDPGITVELTATDEDWNRLTVNWKNRMRAYADEPTTRQDEGSVSRRGVVPASACDWNWITTEQTALTCLWLRMRHHQRTGLIYSWAVNYKYLLNEVGDIVTIADGKITQRPVRILSITESEDGGWLEMTGEDVVVQSSAASPPSAPGGSTSASVTIASPINLPIIFIALIGGLLQVWCLLSGPSGWRGCTVQQSWDATAWETVGSCTTPSPTGHLLQDMSRLRVQPGLRVHPGLLAGAADFALSDYSEGTALPPWPAWGDFLAGNPGALLWVDGELIAYAAETDNGVDQAQCSIMRRGLYGTTRGPHPILSRVGAVTDAAFRWPIPAGNAGRTCYWRFPSFGENPANVQTYSVEIPA